MYPQNKNEVDKFVAGIIKTIHGPARDGILKILLDERGPVAARLAMVTTNVISSMLERVKKQAGRKPHINLLIKSIKMVIKELVAMMKVAGVRVSPEDMKQAAKIAGDSIEAGQTGGGQPMQQGPPQGQQQRMVPQGPPQGAPQGLLARRG